MNRHASNRQAPGQDPNQIGSDDQTRHVDEVSITAALDDALARLQAVGVDSQSKPSPVDAIPVDTIPVDANSGDANSGDAISNELQSAYESSTVALVDAMCQAKNRREAMEAMARAICPPKTSGIVRIGLGTKKLRQLYDSRLGWMGNDSALFERLQDEFRNLSATSVETDPAPIEGAVAMHHPKGGACCVVWIENDRAATSWITAVSEIVSNVLWSRPHRSLPWWMSGMARHSKSWALGIACGLVLIAAWPVQYRIACRASVETSGQRFVATPFEASLQEVRVRPGDQVTTGQVLLVLDGRPLRLEQESLQAELQQASKEQDVARSTRRIADAQQIALKQKKLQRKIDLINDRLQNLSVVSPIDGMIVSGDLQRMVGTPLERGQTLMEVASMDEMMIELEIPEYEIGYASEGMETRLKIDAVGGKSMTMGLDEIFPAAEIREDQNVFIGRIKVDNHDATLRPGMQGEATAYGPRRPWIWSWTRSWVERVMWWVGY